MQTKKYEMAERHSYITFFTRWRIDKLTTAVEVYFKMATS